MSNQVITQLLTRLDEHHPGLAGHQERVERLCERVASIVSFPAYDFPALRQAARLHDIGKLAIPEAVLAKPGPLDQDEWKLLRRHTLIGEEMLAGANVPSPVGSFVRSSHERIDGAGYPDGLAGVEIPLGSRIIFACDAFDAMRSSRPYRPEPLSEEAAIAELEHSSGTQFDAAVVAAVRAAHPEEHWHPIESLAA